MKVLIIGAGAVGQVYGHHLGLGGAEVSVYVREKYASACRAGLPLYPLRSKRDTDRFVPASVLTQISEVAAQRWDQVWLCVSSPALRGQWLAQMLKAIGEATVITLQPGLKDRQLLLTMIPEQQLVSGMITLISYQSPLPGEQREPPGIAYWFPPLSPNPFAGPPEAVRAIVGTLRAGGCPAASTSSVLSASVQGSAILLNMIAGLELAGWSLTRFRTTELRPAVQAARQALAISGTYAGVSTSLAQLLLRAWWVSPVIRIAPHVTPLPLEIYLRYHFTKVGDQTRAALETWIAEGETQNVPTSALEQQLLRLDQIRGG